MEISKIQLEALFKSRRSYYAKHFSGEKIPDSEIETILMYAGMAPNHKKTRPWRFQVFKEAALSNLIEEMKQFYVRNCPAGEVCEVKLGKFEEKKEKTSHIFAIIVHKDEKKRVPVIEEIEAVACAVENIQLSLSTFGAGGYWGTGKFASHKETSALLNLSANEELLGFFFLGVVENKLPKAELPDVNEYISWID